MSSVFLTVISLNDVLITLALCVFVFSEIQFKCSTWQSLSFILHGLPSVMVSLGTPYLCTGKMGGLAARTLHGLLRWRSWFDSWPEHSLLTRNMWHKARICLVLSAYAEASKRSQACMGYSCNISWTPVTLFSSIDPRDCSGIFGMTFLSFVKIHLSQNSALNDHFQVMSCM